MLSGPQTSMPLSNGAHALIRTNLEEIQEGKKARLVAVGTLTDLQLDAINRQRAAHNYLPIVAEVVFLGRYIHNSRVVGDGYTNDDIIDQIASAMDDGALVLENYAMTTVENPKPRADRSGNSVRDRMVLECSNRHPRPELFSVIPKGDHIKPKRPLTK